MLRDNGSGTMLSVCRVTTRRQSIRFVLPPSIRDLARRTCGHQYEEARLSTIQELPPTHSAPPFAAITLPLTHLLCSLTRNPTTSATSSACPILPPSATLTFGSLWSFNACTASWGKDRRPGVSVSPTDTAFTVVPGKLCGNSMAHDRTSDSIAARVALNSPDPGEGSRTRSEEMTTTRLCGVKRS